MRRLSYVSSLGEFYPLPTRAGAKRVVYMAGPGNALAVVRLLAAGQCDLTNSHVGYSDLMVAACQEAGVESLLMLSTHPEAPSSPERIQVGALEVTVMRMPDFYEGKRRLGFHKASWSQANYLRTIVEGFRADVLVVGDDPPRAAALKLVKRTGCKIIRVHHCAITPIRQPRSLGKRLLLGLDKRVAQGVFDAVLTASRQVSDQVCALFPNAPIVEFLPHFDEELHKRVTPLPARAKWAGTPFEDVAAANGLPQDELRCVYVGRIEREKGVFDLLEAAKLCHASGARVSFDLCGDGSADEELGEALAAANIERTLPAGTFRLHGRCNREKMQAIIANGHLGVVPTRSEFVEGFAQVACEFLLSGRPVLVSDAVPAGDYVSGAAKVVRCDDPLGLALDLTYFATRGFRQVERMATACEDESEKFLWSHTSFKAAIAHVLSALAAGERVTERCLDFDGSVVP